MISLFISTATSRLIFSIIKDDEKIFYYEKVEKDSMSEKIMEVINDGFRTTGIDKKNIDKIFVVNGPGSFTGIRVGVTFAKVYAWSIGARLIPVSMLELLATTSCNTKYIMPLIDARRGYVFGALYDSNLTPIIKDQHMLFDNLMDNSDYTIVSDDKFDNLILPKVDIIKIISKHNNDCGVNPHKLMPNYLKLTEAEEKMQKNDKRDQ